MRCTSLSSSEDLTKTERQQLRLTDRGEGQIFFYDGHREFRLGDPDLTIGVVFGGERGPCLLLDGAFNFHRLSDGEFDRDYLRSYPHSPQLAECCQLALDKLSAQPYTGRRSNAQVMGKAMELLRSVHNMDTPRGWLPAMKRLRATAHENPQVGNFSGPLAAEPRVPPEEVLTDPGSPMHAMDSWGQCGAATGVKYTPGSLREAAEERPELKAVLIGMAQKLGVPGGWRDALPYTDAVIEELKKRGEPVPEPLSAIRDELHKRVSKMDRRHQR